MMLIVQKPHLMLGMEWFVLKLATCREIRSLDAEVKLYNIQRLLP